MGVAAYNCGSALIRRQIEDDFFGKNRDIYLRAEREALILAEAKVKRWTPEERETMRDEREIHLLKMLDTLNEENVKLRRQLDRAYFVMEGRRTQVRSLRYRLQNAKEEIKRWYQAFVDTRKGHQKLTAAMKLALTPDQWHQARKQAGETQPELFNE